MRKITEEDKLKLLLNLLYEISSKYDEILAENKILIEKLAKEAKTDFLTGLFNRKGLMEELAKEFERIKRGVDKNLCLAILDLDNFKKINDNYGHLEGDKVLIEVGNILRRNLRKYDIYGRWAGDEFLIGIVECKDFDNPQVCKNCPIYGRIQKEITELDRNYRVDFGASVGAAKVPQEGLDLDGVIKKADKRLYLSKNCGKHKVVTPESEEEIENLCKGF